MIFCFFNCKVNVSRPNSFCQELSVLTFNITRSTTAVNPQHLKVKWQDICLTKNYCISINIRRISSNFIHKFIIKIHQILGSHELKNHGHFGPRLSKIIIESIFSFPEVVPACKKSVHSIYLFLRYSQF